MLGGAGSTFESASSTPVARTAFSARITSSTLSVPCTRGRSRKLNVLTPRATGDSAAAFIEPARGTRGTPRATIRPNSRRENAVMEQLL